MSAQLDLVELVEFLASDMGARVCDCEGDEHPVNGPTRRVRETPALLVCCKRCGKRGYLSMSPKMRAHAHRLGLR